MSTLHNVPALVLDPLLHDTSVSQSGLGSLFRPWDATPVGAMHRRIAEAYGARKSLVLTNGTTSANLLATCTVARPGAPVLVERDCHISVVQTLALIGAVPVWLCPPFDPVLGINRCTTAAQVDAALRAHPGATGVILTRPKYFGVAGDLSGIVAACRRAEVPLVIDEAHGACLQFHPALPQAAVAAGADLVTQSTHKTTEALSQGSVLLLGSDRYTDRFLQVLHGVPAISTSFNFAIACSVELAVMGLARRGWVRLDAALALAERLRVSLSAIPGLHCWGAEAAGGDGFVALDPQRVTVDVSGVGLSGFAVEQLLIEEFGITPEFADLRHVLFIVTYGNAPEEIDRVVEALGVIARRARRDLPPPGLPALPSRLPPLALTPREAFWRALAGEGVERVPVADAVGRVSAETIAVYPPGNALIVQGERFTAEVLTYLAAAATLGAHLKGASDDRFRTVLVLE